MTNIPMADGPLAGRRVLVTRTREQASVLVASLRERGALPVELPTIQVVPPTSWGPVDRAIERLGSFDWIVFTSANAVKFFFDRLTAVGETGHRPVSTGQDALTARIAAIGPATARALQERGQSVTFQPSTFVAEAVVNELARFDLAGRLVLLPCAQDTRDVLVSGLAAQGARVERVVVYQTLPTGDPDAARRLFAEGAVDVVTFTSSSTVQHLVALLGAEAPRQLQNAIIASIGPITTATARDLGLTVAIEAREHTIPGLIAALEEFYGGRADEQ